MHAFVSGFLCLSLSACVAADTRGRDSLGPGALPSGGPIGVGQQQAPTCRATPAASVACVQLGSVARSTVELGVESTDMPPARLEVIDARPTYTATLIHRSEYADGVVSALDVYLLARNDWRRLILEPAAPRPIEPAVTAEYRGVKGDVRGLFLRVRLAYQGRPGSIGDTTMNVLLQGRPVGE